MDPVSVIGIVSTALSVAKVVTQAILKLSELKSRYRNVPLQLSTLIGQLYIVRAALEQISSWISEDLFSSPRYRELAVQIDTSLDCFCPLILTLQQHLDELDLPQDLDMTARSKVSFLWNEKKLMGYLGLLDCQVNALNLFLQAIQCKTLADQQTFVNDEDSQAILQKAKECNTSIIGMSDGTSIFSEGTNIYTISPSVELKGVITTAKAPQSSSSSNDQQTLISSLENSFERSSWPLLPSVDEDDEPDVHGERRSVESDQNAVQLSQASMIDNRPTDHIYPSQHSDLPSRARRSTTALAQAKKISNAAGSGSNSQLMRNIAPIVAGHRSTAPYKSIVTPRSTLLSSRRKSWRTRTTKQDIARGLSERNEIKLLILGSSESGKSTLLKGMKRYTEGGYNREESISFSEIIWSNIVQSFRIILEFMVALEIPLQYLTNDYHVQTIFMQPELIEDNFPPEVAIAVTKLWADAGVKEAYRRRREYQIFESLPYFANHIERLAAPGYVPSQEDIFRSRVKTSGIMEMSFKINDSNVCFRVFDVSGVRSERKKWIDIFENVNSIAFAVDASAYCRLLFEDETVNRMQEQLMLWDRIANSRWFVKTSFVLIFTKIDWLPEQLKLHPVTPFFPDFKEPESGGTTQLIDSYLAYIKDRFLSLMLSEESRRRTRVMYADLIHIDDHNPAGVLFEEAMKHSTHGSSMEEVIKDSIQNTSLGTDVKGYVIEGLISVVYGIILLYCLHLGPFNHII